MPTKDGVINSALRLLGQPPSVGVDDPSKWAARIRGAYDDVLRNVLEDHSWNFAVTVLQLTPSDPAFGGYKYAFPKPARCWKIIKVDCSTDPRGIGILYDDRQGHILSDHETTVLTFVDGSWADREGSWSQKFADLISARIAQEVYPITDESGQDAQRIERAVILRMRDAKAWDAQSRPEWAIPPGRYERARLSRGIRASRYGRG